MKDWQDELYELSRVVKVFGLDFWLNATTYNFGKWVSVFKTMDDEIEHFPEQVKQGKQNISVKLAPLDVNLAIGNQFFCGQ